MIIDHKKQHNKKPIKPLLHIDSNLCTMCYACVRACPVNAIEMKSDDEKAIINSDRCIGCGECYTSCSYSAVKYRDSIEHVEKMLSSTQKVVAIIAPSIAAEFHDITDYRKFVQMIRQLGFQHVNEVAFGADLVANEYLELFDNFKGKYYITSNCPVVVSLIEKYHPELINNLAPIKSPMYATAQVVRDKYGAGIKVVYIGPCLAVKDEILLYDGEAMIDEVLTFQELRTMILSHHINEAQLEFSEFDEPFGGKGALFPIRHGLLQSVDIKEDLLTGTVISTEGGGNVLEAIEEFAADQSTLKRHLDLFFCEGCIMGPGTSPGGKKFLRRSLVINYTKKRLKMLDKTKWEVNVEEYMKLDHQRTFEPNDMRLPDPSPQKVNDILLKLGKTGDDSSGCGSCGYHSCKHFAIAVAQGLASTDMCHTFAMRNRLDYIKTLRTANEKLAQVQDALKISEQNALVEKESAEDAMRTTTAMLQKLSTAVVLVDQNLKIIQSNESFIALLGQEAADINEVVPGLLGADLKTLLPYTITNLFSYVINNNEDIQGRDVHMEEKIINLSIFTIKKNKVVGAVFKDIQAPEFHTEEVISRITEVIDKNLEMVQQMGFILGETAAETERMLNSIIESKKNGDKSNRI